MKERICTKFFLLLFFSDSRISLLVKQINLNAISDKNMQTFKTNKVEIKKLLDVLLTSVYHNLLSQADYWNTAEDLETPIFSKIMARYCFRVIKSCLHNADYHNLAQSKVAKILPILELCEPVARSLVCFTKTSV